MNLKPKPLLYIALLTAATGVAETDAAKIVERPFGTAEARMEVARTYTFHQREEKRDLDKSGNVKSTESKTWDVTLLEGSEYRRLIAKDDQPLSAKQEAGERRKLEKSIAKMQRETPRQRRKRLAKIEKEQEERRKFMREITKAFDFRLTGEETLDSSETYVIEATPKPGYKPPFRRAKVLPRLRGRLWIAKSDYGWVRAEVETVDKISFGWVLFRLAKGARLEFRQKFVNDEVWLMDNFLVRGKGRLGLIKGFHGEFENTFSNFRKFSTESKVVAVEAVEAEETGSPSRF